jgi:Glycosyl transferases group 1
VSPATVTGWVPDVAPWLDAAQIVVCPLMVGGGVKVKVLEALARGCAVVATPIALQGLRHLPPDAVMECADLPAIHAGLRPASLLTEGTGAATGPRGPGRPAPALLGSCGWQASGHLDRNDHYRYVHRGAAVTIACGSTSVPRMLHVIVPQREGAIGGADLHVLDLAVAQQREAATDH